MQLPRFVAVTLSVQEGIPGEERVRLLKVVGIVVTTHADKSIDAYVLETSECIPDASRSPVCAFTSKIPFDALGQSAPSYAEMVSIAVTVPAPAPKTAASAPTTGTPETDLVVNQNPSPNSMLSMYSGMPGHLPQGQIGGQTPAPNLGMYANLPPGAYPGAPQAARVIDEPTEGAASGPRVFGQGARGSQSTRGGPTFRNAELGFQRGEINASMTSRLGTAKGVMPGQSAPRVFVKDGKGSREVTPPDVLAAQPDQVSEGDVLDDILAITDAPAGLKKLSSVAIGVEEPAAEAPTEMNGTKPLGQNIQVGENHGAVGGRPL